MANVEKFKYWCNKILPLVYDDSLSYYEFLGKVYEKLNETIDAVNSNTEAVAEFDQRINDFIEAETAAREGWEDQQERDRQSWETQQAQKWSAFQAMFIAEYDPVEVYVQGDLCSVQYKMYVANASTTGTFDPTKWDEIVLADYLASYVAEAAKDLQDQYDQFLEEYQRTFGVVQTTGTSTTDVMSQDAVTKLSLCTLRAHSYLHDNVLDLDDITAQGRYILDPNNWTINNAPSTTLVSVPQCLIVEQFIPGSTAYVKQTVFRMTIGHETEIAFRCKVTGGWQSWQSTQPLQTTGYETNHTMSQNALTVLGSFTKSITPYVSENTLNLDNLKNQGRYLVLDGTTVQNGPSSSLVSVVQGVTVEQFNSSNHERWIKQTVFRFTADHEREIAYRYCRANGTWSNWFLNAGTVNNITNNYTNNVNENTYNITASPTIAQQDLYVLTATGDDTDRTADIETMLSINGICILGPGLFATTGITMPANSMLRGSGNATKLRLVSTVADGAAIEMKTNCIVEDLRIEGGDTAPTITSTLGTRDGIRWTGLADETETNTVYRGKISKCNIINFTGCAIKGNNTGYGIHTGLEISQVTASDCTAGIAAYYFTEFWQVVACNVRGCYYGCICNGGNNFFSACVFSANTVNLLMDNSNSQSPNNTHGAFVGCAFNHADHNTGYSIIIQNCAYGETFTGCTCFYGKIKVENSSGVIFTNLNGGSGEGVEITNGGLVMFTNSTWANAPTFTVVNNDNVKKINCYTKAGAAIA